jgi:hypothetical protein
LFIDEPIKKFSPGGCRVEKFSIGAGGLLMKPFITVRIFRSSYLLEPVYTLRQVKGGAVERVVLHV